MEIDQLLRVLMRVSDWYFSEARDSFKILTKIGVFASEILNCFTFVNVLFLHLKCSNFDQTG